MILIGTPRGAVVILCHGIFDAQTINGILYIVQIFLIRKFRIVISDDDKSFICIPVVPFLQRRNYMLAINSTERPHVDQHNLAAQVFKA